MTLPNIEPMAVELDGSHYSLKRQTTGNDYLMIRQAATRTDEKGLIILDNDKYEHANLLARLQNDKGESMADAEVRELPRAHYQTLATLGIMVDNEEAGQVSDFLSTYLRDSQVFQSALAKLSTDRADGSAPSSESNTRKRRKTA